MTRWRVPRAGSLASRVLVIVGFLLVTGAVAVAIAVAVGILFFNLMVNAVTIVFTQEFRYYGPELADLDGELIWGVVVAAAAGGALFAMGLGLGARSRAMPGPPGPPPPPLVPPPPPRGSV